MSALRQLIATFFVSADTRELEKADGKIEGFLGKLKEVGEAIAGAFAIEKVKEFVSGQVETATSLERTAIRLGTTTDELQAMDLAAAEAGISADSLANGLRFLNLHIAESQKGGDEASQLFREMGIALKDSGGKSRAAGDVFADVADKIASIDDPAKQTQIAMRLLGRQGAELIPLMKQGGDALDEARRLVEELGGGIGEDFIAQAKKHEAEQAKLSFAWQSFEAKVAGEILPTATKLLTWVEQAVVKVNAFAKSTNVLSTALSFFGTIAAAKALQKVIGLAREFGIIRPTVLQTVGAMLRFALPLALLGLLYLAVDELWTLLKGGDTFIGDALGPNKQAFVDQLRGSIDTLSNAFAGLGSMIGSDGTAMGTFGQVVAITAATVGTLVNWITKLVEGLGWVVDKSLEAAQGLERFLGISSEGEKKQFGGSAENAGLTEEARKRLASIGVKPTDVAPISALGRQNTVSTYANAESVSIPTIYRPGAAQVPSSFSGPLAPGEKAAPSIQQSNKIDVVVHTGSDQPKAVGDAVGAGVATATQRGLDRARTAQRLP